MRECPPAADKPYALCVGRGVHAGPAWTDWAPDVGQPEAAAINTNARSGNFTHASTFGAGHVICLPMRALSLYLDT